MAKQVGLFNLRGKIENKSFYKTAGVPETVIRGIPEGLSVRVKTADEYANTRLNNAEFKQANGIATFGFNAVPNRKASMMRRFAIAEMTKKALEYIKEGTGSWGQRLPGETFDNIIVDLLENRAKSGPYQQEYGNIAFSANQGSYTITVSADDATITDLKEKGIDGLYILTVKGAMAEVLDSDGFVRQHFGVSSISPDDVSDLDDLSSINVASFTPTYQTLGMSPAGYTAALSAANNGMYAIVSFIPYRTIGSQRHSLYEYATFAALALGAIPGA